MRTGHQSRPYRGSELLPCYCSILAKVPFIPSSFHVSFDICGIFLKISDKLFHALDPESVPARLKQ
jgi:hypothetical protein